MPRIVVLAIAALGVASMLGFAPTDAHAYTVKGSVECDEFVREDENESFRLANKFWLLGYITARNYPDDRQTGRDVDSDIIYGMALAICQNDPDLDIDDAAIRVYDILSK